MNDNELDREPDEVKETDSSEAGFGQTGGSDPVEAVEACEVIEADAAPSGDSAQEVALEPTPQKEPWWRGVFEFVVAFAIMLGVIMGLRTWVIEPFQIPSGSMLETIQIGDRVFAEKISVALNEMPEQGEIITFVNPRDTSETLIKRVIAIEGQTIDLRDGDVYVDGVKLDEPYTNGQKTYAMKCDGKVQKTNIEYPYTIPEGYVWVMGDNRGNSADSRVIGPIDASTITGHAVFRYWPIFRSDEDGITLAIGPLS